MTYAAAALVCGSDRPDYMLALMAGNPSDGRRPARGCVPT